MTFFEKVYEVVLLIPHGRATSYGAIARYLGAARSARMVGWAMNSAHTHPKNVPAHRVVNRNGMLTGKHHFGEVNMMQQLLENEGIEVVNDKIQNFKEVYWDPNTELKNALIIFIKNPIKGTVKTRLAKDAGDERALEIYLQLLAHTRTVTQPLEGDRLLYYSRFVDTEDEWSSDDYQKRLQIEGDLGVKMQTAFQEIFEAGYQKAVIIGSDCIALNSEVLEEAFRQLDGHDFVVGPTFDGGYYLIGMKKLLPDVFKDKHWSTSAVFPATIKNLEQTQKSYFLLPKLNDIDHLADWEQHLNKH